jgi:membrane protease YdiL (CAAX protease family)
LDFKPLTLAQALSVALVIQWSLVGLTLFGTAVRGHRLRQLLGGTWKNFQGVKNDFRFASVVVFFLMLSVFLTSLLGRFETSTSGTSPRTPVELILSLFVAISAGITEELVFRGYLLRQFGILAQNEQIGLVGQAVLFSLAHGSGQTFAGMLDKFLAGYFLGWSAMRRNSLLPGIIAHCSLNVLALVLFLFPRALHL